VSEIGTKAEGLRSLGRLWTPEHHVLDSGFARRTLEQTDGSATQISNQLRASRADELKSFFARSIDGVIVRSSAPNEDMASRGLQASVTVPVPTLVTIGEAIKQVWDHASTVGVADRGIAVVIQRYVPPTLLGHLSNERHLREDRRDWVIEADSPSAGSEPRTSGIRALRRDRVPLERVDPSCRDASGLQSALRRVASAFTVIGHRFHLEWIWDGERIWLVQRDAIVERRSQQPRAIGWAKRLPDLSVFARPTSGDTPFPKVRCVTEYIAAGLPHQDLRVLDDEATLLRLARGDATPELDGDLRLLADSKAVLRTDIRREQRDFDVLRARTDAGSSPDRLRNFMRLTLSAAAKEGIEISDVAFLAHAFIPADAAAWSQAAPNSSQVVIDGTFGLPDGLLYYPHDSYAVNLRDPGRFRRIVRCKSQILVSDADGNWTDELLGSPWDWRPALSEQEAVEVARLSKRVADHLGHPVETMFFVRTRAIDDTPSVVPWVHRNASQRPVAGQATKSYFTARTVEVSDLDDVRRLPGVMAEAAEADARVLVRLSPRGSVVRDPDFLEGLVTHCQPGRSEIELRGSTLSHIYYELVRHGLRVHAEPPLVTEESDPVTFDKLVRDLIPNNIAERGEKVVAYRASGLELQRLLRRKIIEEAFEVAGATSINDMLDEVGDALDVLAALCALAGTDLDRVLEWSEQKRVQRGGFGEGLVLVETQEPRLEDAISRETTYSVAPELRADVERERSEADTPTSSDDGVVTVPYGTGGGSTRVLVEGIDLEVEFTGTGAQIRRAVPPDDPDQLSLGI
jgi:predicted house-cleaning noncanonical NTP pyrophosphatase (MazG superfamily)